ncbi:hypothetical protein QJQ45_023440, partial [Haematococcus lacustris]
RPGIDIKQRQRSAFIKDDMLRAGFWDDNKAILQLIYPVTQLQPHLTGTPAAIASSWLRRLQAGSIEMLAEALPLFKARWRYGDSQVLYLVAIVDPRYKISRFQFGPAQFSQAEQVLSQLVTVDGNQADQPLAMVLEQLRRGWVCTHKSLLPVHFAPHLTAHPLKWKRSAERDINLQRKRSLASA